MLTIKDDGSQEPSINNTLAKIKEVAWNGVVTIFEYIVEQEVSRQNFYQPYLDSCMRYKDEMCQLLRSYIEILNAGKLSNKHREKLNKLESKINELFEYAIKMTFKFSDLCINQNFQKPDLMNKIEKLFIEAGKQYVAFQNPVCIDYLNERIQNAMLVSKFEEFLLNRGFATKLEAILKISKQLLTEIEAESQKEEQKDTVQSKIKLSSFY
jgi:hypothetical protein